MSTRKLSKITPSQFRKFLEAIECVYVSTKGGHEKWKKQGCIRPIIIQTHVKPIPEFIVKGLLRTLELDEDEFWRIYDNL